MSHTVFVYGSLRRGMGNHRFLRDSQFVGTTVIEDMFRMISLGVFPGLIREGDPRQIVGEVYQVTDQVFSSLDSLEGHPRFYKREQVDTPIGEAWVYVLPDDYQDNDPVECGDWVEHKRTMPTARVNF